MNSKTVVAREWSCVARSVRGATHKRAGKPNQDAFKIAPKEAQFTSIVLTISDGHGSEEAYLSDVGSRLAVETSTQCLWDFFCEPEQGQNPMSYQTVYALIHDQLPERLVRAWIQAVDVELVQNIPAEQNKTDFTLQDRRPYGATLLGVVITELFILFLQLGDGDILCVDAEGNVCRPLEKDERLIANETTSLSMKEAWREFRIKLIPNREQNPVLIMVSTDGYSNSFGSDDDFFRTGIDYLEWIREEGLVSVEQDLDSVLDEASEKGSGDDITLGILTRLPPVVTPVPDLVEEREFNDSGEPLNVEIDSRESASDDVASPTDQFMELDTGQNMISVANQNITFSVLGRLPTEPSELTGMESRQRDSHSQTGVPGGSEPGINEEGLGEVEPFP